MRGGLDYATTASFSDYREHMCSLNNSLINDSMRSNDDKLTANYVAAMTRAGLQQDLKLKVMEYRLETGTTADLSNDV